MINYHFGSKEQLIVICVQRIINNVVMCFSQDKRDYSVKDGLEDKERLSDWAKQVYVFLFENSAISSISILGDMQNYHADSNSVYTQKGFSMALHDVIVGMTGMYLVGFICDGKVTSGGVYLWDCSSLWREQT